MDHFSIEVGKGPKGSYHIRWATPTLKSENHARIWYNSINIGYGYKKRLVKNGKVIARAFS